MLQGASRIPILRTRFFLLDSTRGRSLTLRDYSKVAAGHKQFVSQKKLSPKDVWRPHVIATPLDPDASGQLVSERSLPDSDCTVRASAAFGTRYWRPDSWPRDRSQRCGSGQREGNGHE